MVAVKSNCAGALRLLSGRGSDSGVERWCQTGPNRGEPFGEEEIINAILEPAGLLKPGELAVDIGAWDGYYLSNVRHLKERHGFELLLFDGDGRGNPEVHQQFFTCENVMEALRDVPDQFAVLSLDIDGFDYWLRKSITLHPALIVMEFQGTLDPLIPVTVPYQPDGPIWKEGDGNHFGASWSAIKNLNESLGYQYVMQCGGLNAFFVREDLARPEMPWNPNPPPVYRYHRKKPGVWLAV